MQSPSEDIASKVEERAWYVSQPQGRPLSINQLYYVLHYLEEIAAHIVHIKSLRVIVNCLQCDVLLEGK